MKSADTHAQLIPIRWLLPLRALWFGIAATLIVFTFLGFKPRYNELTQVCAAEECHVLALAPLELETIEDLGFSINMYAGFQLALEIYLILIFTSLAILIFWLRSKTWIGLVVSLALLSIGLVFFAEESRALMRIFPGFTLIIELITASSVGMMLVLFYIFPDGKFAPSWLRWVISAFFGIIIFEPILNTGGARASSSSLFVIYAWVIGTLLGIYAQIYRYRKVSSPTQRQQTKWVLLGFLCMVAGMAPWAIFVEINPLPPGYTRLIFYLSLIPQYLLIGLFPLAVMLSILQYRLWDIDLVIRRTLSYAVLTASIALIYFGGVVLIQSIFRGLTGNPDSPLITVISTLTIAALFNPLRTRIQDFIDRRFFRAKYDTEKTLASFAAMARDEVDMDRLTGALLNVVADTMQPEEASLWLKK